MHFCHMTNLTAQLFPVQRLARLARSKGIVTIVDGAHALGQFPFKLRDLECDAYGVSLHKWLLAPIGNGCLYVRKEMIPRFWPLQAAPEASNDDIRKFEAIGTHPWAIRVALGEALAYHQAIGGDRKAARLRYLTLRWANALKSNPRIKILTDLSEPAQAWAVAAVNIEGIPAGDLCRFLNEKHRIITTPLIGGAPPNQVYDYQAIRVSPNIYTTLEEIDTFVAAMEDAAKNGVPAAQASLNRAPGEVYTHSWGPGDHGSPFDQERHGQKVGACRSLLTRKERRVQMKRFAIWAVVATALVLVAGSTRAFAQSTFTIPFPFKAGATSLSKGDYSVAPKDDTHITLRQVSTGKEFEVPFTKKLAQPNPPNADPQLVFDVVGDFGAILYGIYNGLRAG